MLDRMVRTGGVSVRLAARFFAARRDGDTIDLGPCRLPMLRQEEAPGRSLAASSPRRAPAPSAFSPSASTPFSRPFDRLRDRSCTPSAAPAKPAATTTTR